MPQGVWRRRAGGADEQNAESVLAAGERLAAGARGREEPGVRALWQSGDEVGMTESREIAKTDEHCYAVVMYA